METDIERAMRLIGSTQCCQLIFAELMMTFLHVKGCSKTSRIIGAVEPSCGYIVWTYSSYLDSKENYSRSPRRTLTFALL